MQIAEMNGVKVLLPANASIGSDGMFDYIEYRGASICNHEDGSFDANGVYLGPFGIYEEDATVTLFDNLAGAIAEIDSRN